MKGGIIKGLFPAITFISLMNFGFSSNENQKKEINKPNQKQIEETQISTEAPQTSKQNININFPHEPTIKQIHQMTIDYAEVNREKIIKWRKQARKRAWFPKISIGMDGDKKRTVSDSIWGSSSSGGKHYLGPDDKSFDSDLGWDVSVSWDFADLIWSSDLATIDSRARNTVKLRENLLNQVTRLYFERRRIQIILQQNEELNSISKMEQQLRIEELTAMIDALTGGKFSQNIKINTNNTTHKEKKQ
ncbi:hypothetical protein MNBD_UNCLBAC01-418 [hydrothermal vent metagenome]|uniref:Outer membrane efflux protein n=1 Tax=hydrothermal vent metagenome TaxID=652676 RepID=A0A3B1D6T9_9ZZZZ